MNTAQNHSDQDSQGWEACPPGELQGLSSRLRTAERRRQQLAMGKTVGVTAGAAAALVVAIGMLVNGPSKAVNDFVIAGIPCSECRANFEAFDAKLSGAGEMDQQLAENMTGHLKGCKFCRDKFEMMYPNVLQREGIVLDKMTLPGLAYAAVY